MGCLDENTVVEFIEGRLEPASRSAAEAHLATCTECRRVVAKTAEALLPTGVPPQGVPLLPPPLRGLAPNDMVGRYRVLRRVGAGAMGVVYAAEDQELRRNVALKLLRADPTQPAGVLAARLKREARAASIVRHPNVVPVHDVLSLEDGSPVLVMDLLVGEPLRHLLERDGPLDAQHAARILVPVLSALEAAHALGVIHRDLKPDNIFLSTTPSGELDVKIVDFGVAKLTALEGPAARSAGLTESGALVGTPYYMAPEQAFGEASIDARADLWAVGVILYECLSGTRPTEAANLGQVLKRLAHMDFAPVEQVTAGIPPRAASLVARLLCERGRRIANAAEVKQELIDIAASRTDELSRPKALDASASLEGVHKEIPRPARRWAAAAAAATVLAATAGLVAAFALPATLDSPPAPDSAGDTHANLSATRPVLSDTPVDPTPSPAISSSAIPARSATVAARPPRLAPAVEVSPDAGAPAPSTSADPTKLLVTPPF